MSTAILEKLLWKFLQTEGVGMTGGELKLVQFAIERSYGTATRSLEVVRRTDQDIVAEKLGDLDTATLRKIASINGLRDGDQSSN